MKRVIAAAFSLLIVFSATILVFAKGTTTKVMITSAELQSPIEISDPEVLKNFNVWSGPGTSQISPFLLSTTTFLSEDPTSP
jgi:hypothetical protein